MFDVPRPTFRRMSENQKRTRRVRHGEWRATRTLTGAAMDMAFMEMRRDILDVFASGRVPTTPRTCNAGTVASGNGDAMKP